MSYLIQVQDEKGLIVLCRVEATNKPSTVARECFHALMSSHLANVTFSQGHQ